MRARPGWLLLSIFVAAILIVLAILGSMRTNHPQVTISFLGYTNLPDLQLRQAVFALGNEHPESIRPGAFWLEIERVDDHKVQAIDVGYSVFEAGVSGRRFARSIAVDVPLQSRRWRASLCAYHPGLRMRLVEYAARHHVLPERWLDSLSPFPNPLDSGTYITNSSIWLTNGPF